MSAVAHLDRPREHDVAAYSGLDDLPDAVVLDTSFVVRALVDSECGHDEAQAFMERLTRSRSFMLHSALLEIELAEPAFKIAIKERPGAAALVTNDLGFAAVPADELRLLVDESRLDAARRRRAATGAGVLAV